MNQKLGMGLLHLGTSLNPEGRVPENDAEPHSLQLVHHAFEIFNRLKFGQFRFIIPEVVKPAGINDVIDLAGVNSSDLLGPPHYHGLIHGNGDVIR